MLSWIEIGYFCFGGLCFVLLELGFCWLFTHIRLAARRRRDARFAEFMERNYKNGQV